VFTTSIVPPRQSLVPTTLRVLGAVGVLLSSACLPSPDLQDPGLLDSAEALFSDRQVWDIQINLSDRARTKLTDNPRKYARADLIINGHELSDVSVRLKGTFSFRNLNGKAAFKLRFDRDEPSRRFLGLAGLTLNNMVQDRALVHEWLSYSVYRAAGVTAPRVGYARVFVDGEAYGLYALVESADASFLERSFDDPSGNLYEEHAFSDLRPDDLTEFELDEGDDDSRRDLAELIALVGERGDEVFTSGVIDTRAFMAFVVADSVLGNWDGYFKSHNYRLYHEPSSGQWSFMPWGLDQTLERRLGAFDGQGLLARKCFALDGCLREFARVGLEVLDDVDDLDVLAELDRVSAFVDGFAAEDPRKPYVMAKYRRQQQHVRAFLSEHPETIRGQLRCVVDGGSRYDCATTKVGCVGDECECEALVVDGAEFLLCAQPASWNAARLACLVQDAELARVDSTEQNVALFSATQRLRPANWFIGLNDRGDADRYVWPTGELARFLPWAEGEPDDFGGEGCAVIDRFGAGNWADEPCGSALPFVCRR